VIERRAAVCIAIVVPLCFLIPQAPLTAVFGGVGTVVISGMLGAVIGKVVVEWVGSWWDP
jgi:hypothetical protein